MVFTAEHMFNIIGALGEVILATAMVPQIYLAHKLNSTEYISYGWQATYISGMVMLISYDLYYKLWPIFFPAVFELACLLYLTCLKIYFEQIRTPPSEKLGLRKDTRSSETSVETASPNGTYSKLSYDEAGSEAGDAFAKQDTVESNYGSTEGAFGRGDEHA